MKDHHSNPDSTSLNQKKHARKSRSKDRCECDHAHFSRFDGFYSIIGLTESNRTLVATSQYDPSGNLVGTTGSVDNPWRYASGYLDSSTGLYKFGARYYDPTIGRWTQQDPLRGSLSDPTSLDRYGYAGDDPVNVTDPSGAFHLDLACILTIIAALGAILAVLSAAGVDFQGIGGLAFLIAIFDPPLGLIVLIIGYLIALVFYLSALAVIYQGIAGVCGLPRIP